MPWVFENDEDPLVRRGLAGYLFDQHHDKQEARRFWSMFAGRLHRDYRKTVDEPVTRSRGPPRRRHKDCVRFALRVGSKFGRDNWLVSRDGTERDKIWSVAFHGTAVPNLASILLEDGLKTYKCIRKAYGEGIYMSPDALTAKSYAQTFEYQGYRYQIVLQVRVHRENISRIVPPSVHGVSGLQDYWIVKKDSDVRVTDIFLYREDDFKASSLPRPCLSSSTTPVFTTHSIVSAAPRASHSTSHQTKQLPPKHSTAHSTTHRTGRSSTQPAKKRTPAHQRKQTPTYPMIQSTTRPTTSSHSTTHMTRRPTPPPTPWSYQPPEYSTSSSSSRVYTPIVQPAYPSARPTTPPTPWSRQEYPSSSSSSRLHATPTVQPSYPTARPTAYPTSQQTPWSHPAPQPTTYPTARSTTSSYQPSNHSSSTNSSTAQLYSSPTVQSTRYAPRHPPRRKGILSCCCFSWLSALFK